MSKKKEIFLVPYAHLDTQWRWEYPTTIRKYIKNTIEENLYLFEKYPEHQFNFTGAIRYAMMKEYYPEGFEQVKKYIEKGRWHFVGTCLEETDTLTPSVESMIRNILYGDRWALKELGTTSRDYMLPDCFGFPANMPSVLKHCDIIGFSTQKLTWGSVVGIPFEIGLWKGPDGAELVCAFNPGSYADHLNPPIHHNKARLKKLYTLGEKNGIWKSFQYYGVGDIGGAPTEGSVKRAIASMEHAKEVDPDLVVKQGAPDEFFREITEEEKAKMDTYEGDLLLTNHSAGTLTSAAIMKRWNRKNELLGYAAEVASVITTWNTGAPYPSEKIISAWYKVIGNQMHDILPGTSTPLAYEYSYNDEVIALKTWTEILKDAAKALAPVLEGEGNLILFNPLDTKRAEIIDIELTNWKEDKGRFAEITDSEGNTVAGIVTTDGEGKAKLTFPVEMEPFSWKKYTITFSKEEPASLKKEGEVRLTESDKGFTLENHKYKVFISKQGRIESIYDKLLDKEVLSKPIAYEFQKERPKLYPAWNMDWKDRKKKPYKRIEKGKKVKVIESSPLRCTLQITAKHKGSFFIKKVSLGANSEIVEFTERIKWRGQGCSLKVAFTFTPEHPTATFNWETSRIERGINNEKLFEMPSRYWVDVSGKEWGISIVEDSKYGYDRPSENTLRMTLLYTPGIWYMQGFWDQKWQDWGEHTIRYALFTHDKGLDKTDIIAKRFNQRIHAFFVDSAAKNDEEKRSFMENGSFLTLSNPQIGVLALKKAEDDDDTLVLRVYERWGKKGEAEVTFKKKIQKVVEASGIERPIKDIESKEHSFTITLMPNELKTYLIKIDKAEEISGTKHEPLELPYNTVLFGKNGEEQGLFPSELVPKTILAGTITYSLKEPKSGENDTVQCKGQILSIPKDYKKLFLLMGASHPCDAEFTWLDAEGNEIKKERKKISSLTGYQGQWDTRLWLKKPTHYINNHRDYLWINWCTGIAPGYINRDRIEWYSTHIHRQGKDEPYKYGYMYTYTFTIPQNAASLQLPNNDEVFLFAGTVADETEAIEKVNALIDKYDF